MDQLAVANKITKALFPDLYGKQGLTTDQVVLLMGSREIIYKALEKEFAVMGELIDAAVRVNGDHQAPHDCYATGPLTGDDYRDLVSCPGCELAAALARVNAD